MDRQKGSAPDKYVYCIKFPSQQKFPENDVPLPSIHRLLQDDLGCA